MSTISSDNFGLLASNLSFSTNAIDIVDSQFTQAVNTFDAVGNPASQLGVSSGVTPLNKMILENSSAAQMLQPLDAGSLSTGADPFLTADAGILSVPAATGLAIVVTGVAGYAWGNIPQDQKDVLAQKSLDTLEFLGDAFNPMRLVDFVSKELGGVGEKPDQPGFMSRVENSFGSKVSAAIGELIGDTQHYLGYTSTEKPDGLNDDSGLRRDLPVENDASARMPEFYPRGEDLTDTLLRFPGSTPSRGEVEGFPRSQDTLSQTVFTVEEGSEDDDLIASFNRRIDEIQQAQSDRASWDKRRAEQVITEIVNLSFNRRNMSEGEINGIKEAISGHINHFAERGRFDLIDRINAAKNQFFPELNE